MGGFLGPPGGSGGVYAVSFLVWEACFEGGPLFFLRLSLLLLSFAVSSSLYPLVPLPSFPLFLPCGHEVVHDRSLA